MPKKIAPLTRAELVKILRERMSLSTKDAGKILESILECVTESLAESTPVSIMGLGRFDVKSSPARPGRNPRTGDFAPVSGRLRPTFSMSKRVREGMAFFVEPGRDSWWSKAEEGIRENPKDAELSEDSEDAEDKGGEG